MTSFVFDVALWDHPLRVAELRQGFAPRSELRSTGIFVSSYLTGASGRRYHGQRAFDDVAIGQTRTLSFCRLVDGDRTRRPPELWESPRFAQRHPYTYMETSRAVRFVNDHLDVTLAADGWSWMDGGGRWSLRAEPLGDRAYWFFVPAQDLTAVSQFHRGQMARLEGVVDGDPVTGFGYLDYSWGPRDISFQFYELPLIRIMNKAWLCWFASFEDGGYITGAARKGREGVEWSMAYVVVDGVASIRTPRTELRYDERHVVESATLDMGDLVIDFAQDCATYYPLHTIGRVSATSLGRPIRTSWTNIEWMPDNAEDLFTAMNAKRIGRTGWEAMTLVDERVRIPGVIE